MKKSVILHRLTELDTQNHADKHHIFHKNNCQYPWWFGDFC